MSNRLNVTPLGAILFTPTVYIILLYFIKNTRSASDDEIPITIIEIAEIPSRYAL